MNRGDMDWYENMKRVDFFINLKLIFKYKLV